MRTSYRDFLGCELPSTSGDTAKKVIMEKVAKLMALADGSTFDGEREAAKAAAVLLLKKHNLTLIQDPIDPASFYEFTEVFENNQLKSTTILRSVLCNFCGMTLYKSGKHLVYCGTYSNLQAFQYILNVVLEQRGRSLAEFKKLPQYTHSRSRVKAVNSWLESFCHGVGKKCRELQSETERQIEKEGLVVVRESDSAYNWLKANHSNIRNTKTSMRNNSHGLSSGKNVTLNKGVGVSGTRLIA